MSIILHQDQYYSARNCSCGHHMHIPYNDQSALTISAHMQFTQVECLGVLLANLPTAVEGRLEPAVHGHGLDPRRPRRRGHERRLLEHNLLHPLLGWHGEHVAPGRRCLHMEAQQQQRSWEPGACVAPPYASASRQPMVLEPAVRTERGATLRPPRRCLSCLAENEKNLCADCQGANCRRRRRTRTAWPGARVPRYPCRRHPLVALGGRAVPSRGSWCRRRPSIDQTPRGRQARWQPRPRCGRRGCGGGPRASGRGRAQPRTLAGGPRGGRWTGRARRTFFYIGPTCQTS